MERDAEGTGSSRPSDDEETRTGVVDDLAQEARDDLERLQKGRHLAVPGAELPIRVVIALGIFVVAFMAVWMLLWAAAGGIGLGLGWILAAIVAGVVVALYARRA